MTNIRHLETKIKWGPIWTNISLCRDQHWPVGANIGPERTNMGLVDKPN